MNYPMPQKRVFQGDVPMTKKSGVLFKNLLVFVRRSARGGGNVPKFLRIYRNNFFGQGFDRGTSDPKVYSQVASKLVTFKAGIGGMMAL